MGTYIALAFCLLFAGAGFGITKFKKLSAVRREAFWKNFYRKSFYFLSNNFLTQKSMRKISDKISMFSVFRRDQINRLSVMYFITAFSVSLIPVMAGIVLFNDVFSVILTVVFAAVLYTVLIEKQFDKVYREILGVTTQFLSSLEIEYQKTLDIPAALGRIKAGDLSKVRDDIVNILTGTGSKQRKQEFFAAMPFRPLRTLAEACYNINLYGDTHSKDKGSNFISAISMIKADINAEIEKMELQKAKIGRNEYIPLIAAAAIAPFEMYLTGVIPALSIVYNGLLGLILRCVTLILAIGSYRLISMINSVTPVVENDIGIWCEKLCRKSKIWNLAYGLSPKSNKRRRKLDKKLNAALSKMTYTHLYLKKAVFAIMAFILSFIMITLSCYIAREYIKQTFEPLSLSADIGSTNTKEIKVAQNKKDARRIIDEVYFEGQGKLSDTELSILIKRYIPDLTDFQMVDEVKRVRDKYSNWTALTFKWWYILIAVGFGAGGWVIPNMLLKLRSKLVKAEAENDFMQLQTLVSTLIYTEIDTLEVLRQMAQNSTVHKEILFHAYHGYHADPKTRLEWLKSKTEQQGFQNFIEKLGSTISELTMREAFSDLISERETLMRLRRIAMEQNVNYKGRICSLMSYLPLIAFACSAFVVPLGYLGVTEMFTAINSLKGMS